MSGIPRAVDKKSWNSKTIPKKKRTSGIPTPSKPGIPLWSWNKKSGIPASSIDGKAGIPGVQ